MAGASTSTGGRPRTAHRARPGRPVPPSVVPDEVVTHEVVRPDLVSVQAAALAAHETQVRVLDGYYALSNDVAARLPGREGFAPVDLRTGRPLVRGSVTGAGSRRGLVAPTAAAVPMGVSQATELPTVEAFRRAMGTFRHRASPC